MGQKPTIEFNHGTLKKKKEQKMSKPSNADIHKEIEPVIRELEKKGVQFNSKEDEFTGLGDVIEETLKNFGVTEEKFKLWFHLKECNCSKRKKWLNNLFSWRKKDNENEES